MTYKQIYQTLSTGRLEILELPLPEVPKFHLLIRAEYSVISPGTEKALLGFGRSNLFQKALAQPDRVRDVRQKISNDGLLETLKSVNSRLDESIPLGYSSSGVVVEVGDGVSGIRVGDRVASNAPHAEYAIVSQNLVARIPDGVSSRDAAFTTISAVAMQAVRLTGASIGETVAVIGAGVVGLLACQILVAAGCRVVVADILRSRVDLAASFGAEGVILDGRSDASAQMVTRAGGLGTDAVLIATSSQDQAILDLATSISRKRGRIVLAGTAGLSISRSSFYEKELSFQVSTSYGPGRYDPVYEEGSSDYPLPYVRWTAKRNMDAVLALMRLGTLSVTSLVSEDYSFENSPDAYEKLLADKEVLTAVLSYRSDVEPQGITEQTMASAMNEAPARASKQIGQSNGAHLIGAGNFAKMTLLPLLRKRNLNLGIVASNSGFDVVDLQRRFGFEQGVTDSGLVFQERSASSVFITTRHDSHADLVVAGLEHGFNVYVEKPMALTISQLDTVASAYEAARTKHPGIVLCVGLNRRYAPSVIQAKSLFGDIVTPKFVSIRVNAGTLPANHWVLDSSVGGGRILSEGIHFIDLARFLIGAPTADWSVTGSDMSGSGNLQMGLSFADGSIASIEYLSQGSQKIPKERIEVSAQGRTIVINNFREIRAYGWRTRRLTRTLRQDKGHSGSVDEFLNAVKLRTGPPVPLEELIHTHTLAINMSRRLTSGV